VISVFTRILTDRERKHITRYLRQDGEKQVYVRKIVYGARRNLHAIKADVELLEELLQAYEKP
jgi:hypothetical protein